MSNIQAFLTGAIIEVVNVAQNSVKINTEFGTIELDGIDVSYDASLTVAGGATLTPSLPNSGATPTLVLYIQNLGSAEVTITPTTKGGSAPFVISPGGIFLYFNTQNSGNDGITALTISSSAGSVVELLMVA